MHETPFHLVQICPYLPFSLSLCGVVCPRGETRLIWYFLKGPLSLLAWGLSDLKRIRKKFALNFRYLENNLYICDVLKP